MLRCKLRKKVQYALYHFKYKNRNNDNKILKNLKKFKISFICLAGYMKIISNKIVKKFDKKIINIHHHT